MLNKLRVTIIDVRAERRQDISKEDAKAEGLVYELFFPVESSRRSGMELVAEAARLNPHDLAAVPEKQKLAA